MKILIITGGSKGIGKALAQKYHAENYTVFSIARSKLENCNYTQITADLSNLNATVTSIGAIFSQIDASTATNITLINNAGTLGAIHTLGNLDAENIAQSIQLNTTAPLVLSNQFIRLTKGWKASKQIINISSGAATNPYQGWSVYCTSKAALNMTTKVISAEQSEIENGVKCIAICPGVVDTHMQTAIRKTHFKNVQRFIDLKNHNELYAPSFVADNVYTLDTENQLENGAIVDIRKFNYL